MSKLKNWDGEERRKNKLPYNHKNRRKENGSVSGFFVKTNNDERYQFENLVIRFRASYNVWQVLDMKKPSFQQLLFEVTGYSKEMEVFYWAKEYIKELKYNKERKDDEEFNKDR